MQIILHHYLIKILTYQQMMIDSSSDNHMYLETRDFVVSHLKHTSKPSKKHINSRFFCILILNRDYTLMIFWKYSKIIIYPNLS